MLQGSNYVILWEMQDRGERKQLGLVTQGGEGREGGVSGARRMV